MNLTEKESIIEGVLFAAGDVVKIDVLASILELKKIEVEKIVDELNEKFDKENRAITIRKINDSYQMGTKTDYHKYISKLYDTKQKQNLSQAAMETLAIIAYKQPVTRIDIENIRGVNCDYAIQLLQANNLIEVVGRKDTVGKPVLFGTTENFLKRFELNSLDDLPNYNELLDRIRVIHSDGESLYREFKIPDEEQSEDNSNKSIDVEQQTTETEEE